MAAVYMVPAHCRHPSEKGLLSIHYLVADVSAQESRSTQFGKLNWGPKNLKSQKFVCLTMELLTQIWRQIKANVPQLTQIGIKPLKLLGC